MEIMDSKEFYTSAELAEILGISRVAVFKRIKNGSIKAQKIGRNFVIYKKDVGESGVLISDIFKPAKDWALTAKEISDQYYCQNSGIFQGRLVKMEGLMLKDERAKPLFSLLVSIAGEIGDNSYDHNLGQWQDVPGIFFGYDLAKRQIVLADRGVGILKTLSKVRPGLKNHSEALRLAFTEIISGRKPEARGNGLKYIRNVILKNPINLIFQTGNAKLVLNSGDEKLDIQSTGENIRGCIAFITY